MNGALTRESFFTFRKIVNAHVIEEFKPKKDELMHQRIEAYNNSNDVEYGRKIAEASTAYLKMLQERFKLAIEFVDLSEENYKASF